MKPNTKHLATGRKRKPAPRPIDPLAPLSDKYLRRQVTGDVQAQVNPIIAQLTKDINDRAAAGSRNISGVSEALAQNLQPYAGEVAGIYSNADKSLGAIDSQLADRLGASPLAGDLRARLAAAGGDTSLADSLTAAAHGAAGAGFAHGAADRQALVTQGAGATDYASKLPGLARLAGVQQVGQRQAQAQQDLSSQIGGLRSSVPGLIVQALTGARTREYEKGVARLGFQGDVYKTQAQIDQNAARIRAQNQRASQSNATRRESNAEHARHDRAQEAHNQAALAEAARGHDISIAKAKAAGRKPSASLSGKYGWIVDGNGRPIRDKHGKKIPVAKSSDPLSAIYNGK